MIKNYFKSAWRSLWKNRSAGIINIAGLSIGMTASVLILIWVQNEMRFDRDQKDGDKIYRLTTELTQFNWKWESTPLLFAGAISKEIPEIEQTARQTSDNQSVITVNGHFFYQKKCAYVDSNWFNLFQYDFIEGNPALFRQDPYGIVFTSSAAKKYFGNEDALGASVRVDSVTYIVKGIIRDAPTHSSFQFDAYLPLAAVLRDPVRKANDEDWGNYNYITFVKLRPHARVVPVEKKLTATLVRNSNGDKLLVWLTALKDMHFEKGLSYSSFPHGNINTVYIFSVLAFLLLLIACINYVNLTTAKASLRAKEVSVRKIIGAKRQQLFYQFVAESLLISVIALFVTILLIHLCLPVFNSFTGKNFELPILSPSMWEVLGLTLSFAFLLNSIYPALLLSSFKPLNIFRGINILRVKNSYFRKSLVVVQFTISIILIAGTIIIYRQMLFIQHTNPGYDISQVFSIMIPGSATRGDYESLLRGIKQDMEGQPGIESVSTANQAIIDIGSRCSGCADWTGRDTSFRPTINQLAVDAEFQKTLSLKMKEGRWFQKNNSADRHGFILNETALKEFNMPQPIIGQRFIFKGDTGQVIGVVKDFHYKSLHDKIGPVVVFIAPTWTNRLMVRASSKNASAAVASAGRTWAKWLPGIPFEYSFMDENFNDLYKDDQQSSVLILAFAIIAVFISAMGLYGLAAFAAEQRSKEIGIRKVLGATVASISGLLSWDFVKLVCISIVLALPVANWASRRWIENFAYRADIDWWIYAISSLLAIAIALGTISVQAIRAAMANPVNSLRSE